MEHTLIAANLKLKRLIQYKDSFRIPLQPARSCITIFEFIYTKASALFELFNVCFGWTATVPFSSEWIPKYWVMYQLTSSRPANDNIQVLRVSDGFGMLPHTS